MWLSTHPGMMHTDRAMFDEEVMSAKIEFVLSFLVVIAIGLAVYAFLNGSIMAFVLAQMILMPGIVVMTFIVLSRAERRKRGARFRSGKMESEETDGERG